MQTLQLPSPGPGRDVWVGRGLEFTPDGRYLHANTNTANLLDTTGADPPGVLPAHLCGFVRGATACVRVVNPPWTGEIEFTDLGTRKRTSHHLKGVAVGGGTVSPDGTLIYLAVQIRSPGWYSNPVSEIVVWSATHLRKLRAFGRHRGRLRKLELSADGGRIAGSWSNGCALGVWDASSNRPGEPAVRVEARGQTAGSALSGDGSRLAAAASYGLTIWDTTTGERVAHSGLHRLGVTAVACCPTKPVLVTGDRAGKIFLWDYTGRVLTRYTWKLKDIRGLAFAPDGLRCAAVDAKGRVVIWDVDV
jgi:WD40 repeat protein